jgi:hypothetical protein
MGGVSPEKSSSTALKMEATSSSETSIILPTNSASFTLSPVETSAQIHNICLAVHYFGRICVVIASVVGSSVNGELLRN